MSRVKKRLKVGDVVEITYDAYRGETGKITKQRRVDAPDLWWVKFRGNRVVRFHECWLKLVKPKPARVWTVENKTAMNHGDIHLNGSFRFCANGFNKEIVKELNRLERKIAKLEKGVINGRA